MSTLDLQLRPNEYPAPRFIRGISTQVSYHRTIIEASSLALQITIALPLNT